MIEPGRTRTPDGGPGTVAGVTVPVRAEERPARFRAWTATVYDVPFVSPSTAANVSIAASVPVHTAAPPAVGVTVTM